MKKIYISPIIEMMVIPSNDILAGSPPPKETEASWGEEGYQPGIGEGSGDVTTLSKGGNKFADDEEDW